jgi:transcriptional regulator with PAS, ATPase and Fis domain
MIAATPIAMSDEIVRADMLRDDDRPVDPLAELLQTLSEVLDVRGILPKISRIANQVIAHDSLGVVVCDRSSGHVTLETRSPEAPAWDQRAIALGNDSFRIVADLRNGGTAPGDHTAALQTIVAAGYRSSMTVGAPAGRMFVQLAFVSRQPAAYTKGDLAIARRIAACLAVAVSHEALAKGECDRQPRSNAGVVERSKNGVRAVGESVEWRQALTKATQVAATEATVFLQGESGTGKEVLARFIHRASPRRNGPFVAINCAALPEQLLESEMFGYERGAFTGALQAKPGQIELASTGVLFLDEVSEMSLAAQAKLLRFLQEREFQRVGGTRLVKANVRVIAASNRDLREAVQQGKFREDLFYRLQVFDIPLPPLRERRHDIPLLAEAFLQDLARSLGRVPARLSPAAMNRLLTHSWPGNVRELQNALERAAILCEDGTIGPEHLSLHAEFPRTDPGSDLGAAARQTIERVLRETDWNKSKAARRLGLTRTQLYVRLRKYGLEASLDVPAV